MQAQSSAILHDGAEDRRYSFLAAAVITLTTVSSLVLSRVRMMWADEFLSYWGDKLPSAGDVIRVQLHTPISLDPPLYHLLAHWSMQVLGANEFGMRVPALLGIILSQVALFLLVRRLAGGRAGVLAAALPAVFGPFWYSAEGRPYGWLLGMYGVAMLCWVVATSEKGSARRWPLIGLGLAIAGAITSHYFGVLILLPLAAAQLVQTLDEKRVDWHVVLAIVLGACSLALILPFQHALLVFKLHYYNRHVTTEAISLGFNNAVSQSNLGTHAFLLFIVVAGALRFRKRAVGEPRGLWAMLLTLALMPLWCFLFEKFVTHSMEGRYAIPASLAFVVVLALVLEPVMQKGEMVFSGVLVLVLLVGLASIATKVHRELHFRHDFMSDLALPPGATLEGSRYIYVNSFGNFLQDQYYAPPAIQSRLAYVYDADKEIQYKGRDTHSISAENVHEYSPLRVVHYSDFLKDSNPVFIDYGVEDWEWLSQDLKARDIAVKPLGTLMLGHLEQADTHASGMAAPPVSR